MSANIKHDDAAYAADVRRYLAVKSQEQGWFGRLVGRFFGK